MQSIGLTFTKRNWEDQLEDGIIGNGELRGIPVEESED